jgi:hypothetical protein
MDKKPGNEETLLMLMLRCQIIGLVIRTDRPEIGSLHSARLKKVRKRMGASSSVSIFTAGARIFKTSSGGLGILGGDAFSARIPNIKDHG